MNKSKVLNFNHCLNNVSKIMPQTKRTINLGTNGSSIADGGDFYNVCLTSR